MVKSIDVDVTNKFAVDVENNNEDDVNVINKNVYDIFAENDGDDFQFELLASKKKLNNKPKNTLLDVLKLKMKALDMMILILTNNKTILKTDEVMYLDEIASLLPKAKLEKEIFEPMIRRIKTIISFIVKNQLNFKNTENYPKLCKFIVEIMNTHFENSFLQQIIDLIKFDTNFCNIFVDTLLGKFFVGRNNIIKSQDIKFLIKHTFSHFGHMFYLNKLTNYLLPKEKGGSRTNHQVHQVFHLLSYCFDIFNNKTNSAEKLSEITNENLVEHTKTLLQIIKAHLVNAKIKEDEPETKASSPEETPNTKDLKKHKGSKNQVSKEDGANIGFFNNFFNVFSKLLTFLSKTELSILTTKNEALTKKIAKVLEILEQISTNYKMNNQLTKIKEIKQKYLI